MKITRTRTLHVNLGNYENMETSATIEVDDTDVVIPKGRTLTQYLDTWLDELLADDVQGMVSYTSLDEEQSFIHTYSAHHHTAKVKK